MNRRIKLRVWCEKEQVFTALLTLDPSETRPVVEFTGIYDASGAEIWEGDVLAWSYQNEATGEHLTALHKVIFHQGGFGTVPINQAGTDDFDPFCNLNTTCGDVVVGHVFTNQFMMPAI